MKESDEQFDFRRGDATISSIDRKRCQTMESTDQEDKETSFFTNQCRDHDGQTDASLSLDSDMGTLEGRATRLILYRDSRSGPTEKSSQTCFPSVNATLQLESSEGFRPRRVDDTRNSCSMKADPHEDDPEERIG